jgi:hypothetical protein
VLPAKHSSHKTENDVGVVVVVVVEPEMVVVVVEPEMVVVVEPEMVVVVEPEMVVVVEPEIVVVVGGIEQAPFMQTHPEQTLAQFIDSNEHRLLASQYHSVRVPIKEHVSGYGPPELVHVPFTK